MRQERLGAVHDAPEVDVHHPFDLFELADFDVPDERDAGVVVDLVDFAKMVVDLLGVGDERFPLGDVEPVGLDRGADGLEPFLGLRQPVGVDIADGHACPGAGQFDGQRLADTRTGAGDDGDFPGEPLHACTPVSWLCRASRYGEYDQAHTTHRWGRQGLGYFGDVEPDNLLPVRKDVIADYWTCVRPVPRSAAKSPAA